MVRISADGSKFSFQNSANADLGSEGSWQKALQEAKACIDTCLGNRYTDAGFELAMDASVFGAASFVAGHGLALSEIARETRLAGQSHAYGSVRTALPGNEAALGRRLFATSAQTLGIRAFGLGLTAGASTFVIGGYGWCTVECATDP